MDIKNISQSKLLKSVLYGVGALLVVLLAFQAGVFIGYRKAGFSYRWGDNYYRTFGEHDRRDMRGFPMHNDFPDAYGAVGKIIRVTLPTLVIEGEDNIEKIILIKDNTAIRRFRDVLQPNDLKVDDFVVVIGSPNAQAQIEAKFIRLMPTPPEMTSGSLTRPQ